MAITPKKLSPRASISLQLMATTTATAERLDITRPRSMAAGAERAPSPSEMLVPVIVEGKTAEAAVASLEAVGAQQVEHLAGPFVSAVLPALSAAELFGHASVIYVETVKEKHMLLENAVLDGRIMDGVQRTVSQTGTGVVVGVVDSGFDLSHPAFRDSQGKLRVDALLDQTTNKEFTTADLEQAWRLPVTSSAPGFDAHGHGTHVTSIAAGSTFSGLTGVAPDARLVLVKTDFQRIANGVKWCFSKAGNRPCVVNLSLGGHFGGHDGTGREERTLDLLSGEGKIIVIAAGNEREDDIHAGGDFATGRSGDAIFDIAPNLQPVAVLTAWYDKNDIFDIELISPSGTIMPMPAVGQSIERDADGAHIQLARNLGASLTAVECQIIVEFSSGSFFEEDLRGWRMHVTCKTANIGRFDAWLAGQRIAQFRPGTMAETKRTIGMPATAKRAVAVASHVTKNTWHSDLGDQSVPIAVIGRSSRFSSRGPTRDGRQKPEISAPGEMITAALADGSDLARNKARARSANRTLSIEGTSMATPFVTGVVALLLQADPKLTPEMAISALKQGAAKDNHTGPTDWTPEYGHGKINAKSSIALVGPHPTPVQPIVAAAEGQTMSKPKRKKAKASA